MRAQRHCVVTFQYWIEPVDPEPFPYPRGPYRMEVLLGEGRLPPSLEQLLLGMEAGERTDVTLEPGAMFGPLRDDAVTEVPRSDVVEEGDRLQVGAVCHLMDEKRRLRPFRVRALGPNTVLADFNHPLAGRRLRLRVTMESVRWAALEEIKQARLRDAHCHDAASRDKASWIETSNS